MITLTMPIKAVPKQSFRIGKHNYQSAPVRRFAKAVKMLALSQTKPSDRMLCCALAIDIDFCYALPKGTPKHIKDRIASGSVIPKQTRPDIDNLCKGLLDALSGVMWEDDAIITSLTARKVWAAKDEIVVNIFVDTT